MVNSGDKPPLTPNFDRMATEGTIFTRFHTLASVCSPSRASWLTGSWPLAVKSPYIFSCNHDINVANGQGDFVNLSVPFIPRLLHNNGWRTAHYGKCSFHLSNLNPAYIHITTDRPLRSLACSNAQSYCFLQGILGALLTRPVSVSMGMMTQART